VETQSLYQAELKIMIDCDELMQRKDLRKVVNRKKEERKDRKESKTGV